MDPVLQLLSAAGVAGVVVWLFVTDKLVTKKSCDERVALALTVSNEVVKQWSDRFSEMRSDRNEWRRLALGTEKRLDVATPTVATAIGAPIPSPVVASEADV